MDKKGTRQRRAKKTRAKIKELNIPRLGIHRSLQHIYAQIIMPDGKVAVCASSLDKEIKEEGKGDGSNITAAKVIGKFIALRAKATGIIKVAFDRSGFKYHGRVKALADAARENGLEF
jgi:large subunit ribosomal protein L18